MGPDSAKAPCQDTENARGGFACRVSAQLGGPDFTSTTDAFSLSGVAAAGGDYYYFGAAKELPVRPALLLLLAGEQRFLSSLKEDGLLLARRCSGGARAVRRQGRRSQPAEKDSRAALPTNNARLLRLEG